MVDDHFSLVAHQYRGLRTTDPEPVRYICERLPETSALGVDVGCGTGRYTELLCEQLSRQSVIVAADSHMEMLCVLKTLSTAGELIQPVEAQAENLPLRRRSVDWITTFNAVHHFNLAMFLRSATKILKPRGRLFIYTRTPEQNARSIWGTVFHALRRKKPASEPNWHFERQSTTRRSWRWNPYELSGTRVLVRRKGCESKRRTLITPPSACTRRRSSRRP